LKARYKDILVNENIRLVTPLWRGVQKVISAAQIEFLYSISRFFPELAGGALFTFSNPEYIKNPNRFPKAIADAVNTVLLKKNRLAFRNAVELAEEGAYGKFIDAEFTSNERIAEAAKKAFRTISSPDSFQETGFGRAMFISAMRTEFKRITGEELAFTKLADQEYINSNRESLQAAAKKGLIESKLKPNSSFGRPLRPYYILGASLDASKGDLSLLARNASYFLGGWAARTGSRARNLSRDAITGRNFGTAASLGMLGGFIGSAMVYQLTRDAQKYAVASLFGDDEEEKQAQIEFERTIKSPEYIAGQFASSMLFLSTGRYGSIGKAATFGAGDLLIRSIEHNAIQSGKSVV
jgi:hypothetical protein